MFNQHSLRLALLCKGRAPGIIQTWAVKIQLMLIHLAKNKGQSIISQNKDDYRQVNGGISGIWGRILQYQVLYWQWVSRYRIYDLFSVPIVLFLVATGNFGALEKWFIVQSEARSLAQLSTRRRIKRYRPFLLYCRISWGRELKIISWCDISRKAGQSYRRRLNLLVVALASRATIELCSRIMS